MYIGLFKKFRIFLCAAERQLAKAGQIGHLRRTCPATSPRLVPPTGPRLSRTPSGTKLGDDFLNTYGLDTINPVTGKANDQVIVEVFHKLYGAHDPRIVMSRIQDTIQTAIDSGSLTRIPEEVEEVAVPAARNDQGQFQSRLLAEYHSMLDDPTVHSGQISARMHVDAAFREAVESESRPKPQRQTGLIPSEEERVSIEAFATAFRMAPNPKFLSGYITIGDFRYTRTQFDEVIAEASRLNLL